MEGSGVGGMGYEANVGNSSSGTMVMMMMPPPFLNSPFSPNPNNITPAATDSNENASMKALIMSHPHYPRLLAAYISCRKFGAPPEVVAKLEEAYTLMLLHRHERRGSLLRSTIGENPELDQFMEAYCEVLTKYQQELTNTFTEAMTTTTFCSQGQNEMSRDDAAASYLMNQLSEGDVSGNNVEIDPQAEEGDLKLNLLRKYGSYLGGLKRDFMNKRKNEKLPKKALQQLNEWWTRHQRWPYPSDLQKAALVESTGLDQKQINNWFTNQRKRHWKRSNEMQFARMQGMHSAYYNMNDGSSSPL